MSNTEEIAKDYEELAKLNEGNYCIVLYASSLMNLHNSKVVSIYKDLQSFIEKVDIDAEKIDPMYSLDTQFWIFD